jgi:hypothetical protein
MAKLKTALYQEFLAKQYEQKAPLVTEPISYEKILTSPTLLVSQTIVYIPTPTYSPTAIPQPPSI